MRRRLRRTAWRARASCSTSRPTAGCGCLRTTIRRSGSRESRAETGRALWAAPTGQQAVYAGQRVREEQPAFTGHLQDRGHLEVRCRMTISPRSMAALWLCGFEEQPDHCGEICVTEVFGKDVVPGQSAEVGVGLKQIRDPNLARGLRRPAPADRRRRVPHVRRRLGRHRSGLQRGRREGPHLPRASYLSPAGDGRGLRLPGMEHRRRRPPRARARRRQDQRRLSVTPRGSAGRSAPRRNGCRCASR